MPNCKSFLVTEAERKHVRRRASLVAVACFLPGRAKDLSAPLYIIFLFIFVLLSSPNKLRLQTDSDLHSSVPVCDDSYPILMGRSTDKTKFKDDKASPVSSDSDVTAVIEELKFQRQRQTRVLRLLIQHKSHLVRPSVIHYTHMRGPAHTRIPGDICKIRAALLGLRMNNKGQYTT